VVGPDSRSAAPGAGVEAEEIDEKKIAPHTGVSIALAPFLVGACGSLRQAAAVVPAWAAALAWVAVLVPAAVLAVLVRSLAYPLSSARERVRALTVMDDGLELEQERPL